MKVILTGATGDVGEGVLLAMLDDNRTEKVLSVGRRPCGHSHAKLEEYIVPDFMQLEAGDERLAGYDVVFFIAGITSVGTPKDAYRLISHDIPVHFASVMPDKERMSFIYLSGAGTTGLNAVHSFQDVTGIWESPQYLVLTLLWEKDNCLVGDIADSFIVRPI